MTDKLHGGRVGPTMGRPPVADCRYMTDLPLQAAASSAPAAAAVTSHGPWGPGPAAEAGTLAADGRTSAVPTAGCRVRLSVRVTGTGAVCLLYDYHVATCHSSW